MTKRFPIVIACLGFAFTCTLSAQNLVPNPGFETYTTCPSNSGDILFATPWQNGNGGSADYLNACANIPGMFSETGVPENNFTVANAYDGQAYANIYIYNPAGNSGGREYVQVQLTAPLIAGQDYFVGYHYLMSTRCRYALDDLGLYLSAAAPTQFGGWYYGRNANGTSPCTIIPQFQTPNGVPQTNDIAWQELSGTYTAIGGEQWITAGAFNRDTDYTIFNKGIGGNASYYLLDGFFVIPITTLGDDLLSFEAVCDGTKELIQWEIAPSALPAKCVLEYAADGKAFKPVFTADPAPHNYSYESDPAGGYYRLTLYGSSSEAEQSDVISTALCSDKKPSNLIRNWHYAGNELKLGFNSENVAFQLSDCSGKVLVLLQQLTGKDRTAIVPVQLFPGVYVLSATDGWKRETTLVFVE